MYNNPTYKKEDAQFINRFILEHPFATMVLKGDDLLATHIPVMILGEPEEYVLYAHIAHNNPQIDFLKDDVDVLLIFRGSQSYISSSWYEEPDISTWDYSAVHINGKIKIQTELELVSSLRSLTNHFEEPQEKPLYFSEIPSEIINSNLSGITGFWIYPNKIQAIAKHSQNKNESDLKSIIEHLENGEHQNKILAKEIKKENDKND